MAKEKRVSEKNAGNESIIAELGKDPTERNWERARAKILEEGRYYFIFYPKELKGKMSLLDAHAVIYGRDHKSLYKIPVIKRTARGIEGATIYLKGLEINRKLLGG
jgi:hypothetical protein